MNFWKIDPILEDFRNGSMAETTKFHYLIAILVIESLGLYGVTVFPTGYSAWHEAGLAVLDLAILIGGCFACFHANTAFDGQRFVERAIILTLPITVRILALFGGFLVVIAGVSLVLDYDIAESWGFGLDAGVTVAIISVYVWWLYGAFKKLSRS